MPEKNKTYIPEMDAPSFTSQRERITEIKKALQESKQITVSQSISLSKALAFLPEWVRDLIETGITVYDFVDSRLITDGKWVKVKWSKFGWNFKTLIALISALVKIWKTWRDPSVDKLEAEPVKFKTHKIANDTPTSGMLYEEG